MWVYIIKTRTYGLVKFYKAHLVVKSFTQKYGSYSTTYLYQIFARLQLLQFVIGGCSILMSKMYFSMVILQRKSIFNLHLVMRILHKNSTGFIMPVMVSSKFFELNSPNLALWLSIKALSIVLLIMHYLSRILMLVVLFLLFFILNI